MGHLFEVVAQKPGAFADQRWSPRVAAQTEDFYSAMALAEAESDDVYVFLVREKDRRDVMVANRPARTGHWVCNVEKQVMSKFFANGKYLGRVGEENTKVELTKKTLDELIEIYNGLGPEKELKSFRDKDAAIERVSSLIESKKVGRGRASKFGPATKIKLVATENPKRKGSACHDRYELYRTKKTVGDFLEAGGTRGDLAWDSKQKFIELSA